MANEGRMYAIDSPWPSDELNAKLKAGREAQEELIVRQKAASLAHYMGDGWEPLVSEVYGMGHKWSWGARRGPVTVTACQYLLPKSNLEKVGCPFGCYFTAMIGDPEMAGTGYIWYSQYGVSSPRHGDPRELVRLQREHCLAGIQDRINALHGAQTYIDEWDRGPEPFSAPLPPPAEAK